MSDDILSGGAIDPSTSGPIPPSKDDRDRDILLQQKEKQDQDAIGGTQFPPRTQPLPPIPEAVEVAPALPVIPSFDFNISGSALEETREIARQTVVDVLKNVTINGQGPSFEGSAITFNIPQQPPASEAFIFQGIMVPQPLPPIQTIQATALPQLAQTGPAQEVQSVVVAPPTRQQPTPNIEAESVQETKASESIQPVLPQTVASPSAIRTQATEETPSLPSRIESAIKGPIEDATTEEPLSLTQEPTFLEPAKPPTEMLESDVILPQTEVLVENAQPVEARLQQPPKDGVTEDRSQQEPQPQKSEDGEDEDFKPAYSGLSDYPTFKGKKEGDRSQQTRDEARTEGPDITIDRAQEIRESARKKGPDITFEGAQEIREEARKSTAATSAEEAESQAKEKRKERVESDSDFDRESPTRQKGETQKEFKERQEELKQERAEQAKKEEKLKRTRMGDIEALPSGMIPVKLTRADGQKAILAFMATEFVGVVEGATEGDRPATLPSESSYYLGGGGGASCVGLALYTKTVGVPPEQQTQVWVDAGTVAGQLPSGFDYFNGKFIANGGSGTVWIELNIDENTGEIVSVAVDSGSEVPQRTNSSFYYALGYYEYTESGGVNITNYGCGSVNAAICRNWFTATPPFYGVSFSR